MRDFVISFDYDVEHSTKITQKMPIDELVEYIKTDKQLKDKVEALRAKKLKTLPTDEEELKAYSAKIKKLKAGTIPYFNMGTFKDNIRNAQNLESTQFLIFDCDHLEDAKAFKAKLTKDPTVFMAFISPSGDGVKVIIKFADPITNSYNFTYNYLLRKRRFESQYGIVLDATIDSTRACFFSYDPELYFNFESVPIDVKTPPPVEEVDTKSSGYSHYRALTFFNEKHTVEEMLLRYDCIKHPYNNSWMRPGSTSGMFGINVIVHRETGERGISCHHTGWKLDTTKGVDPKTNKNTHYFLTAFGIYQWMEFGKTDTDFGRACTKIEADYNLGLTIDDGKPANKKAKLLNFDILSVGYPDLFWVVPDMIPEGLTVLAGAPKIGKSWFGYHLCIATATGTEFMGYTPPTPARAVYFALEDSERRLQSRLKLLLPNATKVPDLLELGVAGSLGTMADEAQEGLLQLANLVKEKPDIKLIVIDTLECIRGEAKSKMNAYQQDVKFLRPIQELAIKNNLSIVLITHTSQSKNEDTVATITGSYGQGGTADTVLVMTKKRTTKTAKLLISGREVEERELTISLNRQFKWEKVTIIDEDGAAAMAKISPALPFKIKEVLARNAEGFKSSELTEEINRFYGGEGVDGNHVRNTLTRLKKAGKVSVSRYIWQLVVEPGLGFDDYKEQ